MSLQQQTQENLSRVNDQLDALVQITGNQKVMASTIYNELGEQTKMIDDVSGHMDKAQNEVNLANRLVFQVKASSGTCAAWCLMVLLLIAIVIIWCLPKKLFGSS